MVYMTGKVFVLCDLGEIEDEVCFMFECLLNDYLRVALLRKIPFIFDDMFWLNVYKNLSCVSVREPLLYKSELC